jgi:prepilin-type N-terminal cleavage/methylation domain-containing protein
MLGIMGTRIATTRLFKHNGFSLIEIVAAVMILSIMFGGLSALRVSHIQYARKMEIERDVSAIQDALTCYLYFHGEEPEGLEDLTVEKLIRRGFLFGENKSPQGFPYSLKIGDHSISVEIEEDG